MTDAAADIRMIHGAIGAIFRQMDRLHAETLATKLALSSLIDIARPKDDAAARRWLARMSEVAVANAEARAAAERVSAIAEGKGNETRMESIDEQRALVIQTIRELFEALANGVGGRV